MKTSGGESKMDTYNKYYKLAALEALDILYYTFNYQSYDPNYSVLQKSAGTLGMIGTRLICNIAFEDSHDTQAKIAHVLLPIIMGFGLYFMTAKKGDTLKTCLYNYRTQMLSHTLQSFIYFTPQKTIDKQFENLCPDVLLKLLSHNIKKKEKIGSIIYKTLNTHALEQPKGFPRGLVRIASVGLNLVLQIALKKVITPVAQRIVSEKVDIFVTSVLTRIVANYTTPLIMQRPVCSGFFASLGPSKISPMFLASYAFATAINEDIECSLWTSETES